MYLTNRHFKKSQLSTEKQMIINLVFLNRFTK